MVVTRAAGGAAVEPGAAAPDARPPILGIPLEALRPRLGSAGIAPYRAEQIASWLYARGESDFARMTDLGEALRAQLAATWATRALEVEQVRRSRDGTIKALLAAADGARVESVWIPEEGRGTLCLSTQVGCPLACAFCATGALGFARNLSSAEIVDQVCRVRELLPAGARVTNVVFMGMGEPLLNLPAVLDAIRILTHPRAFALAGRRITVSTVGVVPRLAELVASARVNLAVSLHAASDALRDELVPLNRRYPIGDLLSALRALPQVTRRWPVFFEYTLIAGVNDAPEEARGLVRRLRGLPAKLNLIPMNAHADSPWRPPDAEAVQRFLAEVARGGLPVTLRRSRGADIDAACGQLAMRGAAPAGRARAEPAGR